MLYQCSIVFRKMEYLYRLTNYIIRSSVILGTTLSKPIQKNSDLYKIKFLQSTLSVFNNRIKNEHDENERRSRSHVACRLSFIVRTTNVAVAVYSCSSVQLWQCTAVAAKATPSCQCKLNSLLKGKVAFVDIGHQNQVYLVDRYAVTCFYVEIYHEI